MTGRNLIAIFTELITLAAIVVPAVSAADPAGLRLEQTDAAITVHDERGTVLVYNKRSPPLPDGVEPHFHRSGFLHPVATPSGRVVTAVFPADHKHQDGIFSAWVKTTYDDRNVDFWNLAGGTGRVLHERVVSTFRDETYVGFEVDLIHRAVADPVVDILRERWKITVRATEGDYRCFDLETTQSALTDVPLLIQKFHYGGIALRGPVRWLEPKDRDPAAQAKQHGGSSFLNDRGSNRLKGNHEKARWVSLHGRLNGTPASITVLSHAENFRAPQVARLHPTKPYFCYAPCFEGQFRIDKDHPFSGRYRFLVTDAAPDPDWLNDQWSEWTAN